ncbi:MAG TPA: hypothetical protein VK543_07730 [Puia sp.]|nr:hypothetical protein [Puia sp.]
MITNHSRNLRSYFDTTTILVWVAWAFVNGFFLVKNGIIVTGEAEKYIREAHLFIQTGQLSAPKYWLYFTEIFLLTVCFKLRMGFVFAIAVQLLVNLVASLSFYRILQEIFCKQSIAFLGTVLLLFNQPYQEFNSILQTESLFYSLTLIYSCHLLSIKKWSAVKVATNLLLLVCIVCTRPTGLLFLPPGFIYLYFTFFRGMKAPKKIGILGAMTIAFLFVLDKALGSGGGLDFMLPYRQENIICGVPTLSGVVPIHTAENGNSIYGLFYYVSHNFSQFSRLAWQKTLAFFGLYRSYYSPGHNIYLIVYFNIIHITAIAGIRFWIKSGSLIWIFLFSIIGLTWLSVMLTCDDWHNRFYLGISPYFILLSMGFVTQFFKRK